MRYKINEAGYLLGYDGLETLGDSVLGLYVCQISFKQGLNKEWITKNKQ